MANNVVCEGDRFLLAWTAAEDPLATNSVVLGQYWTLAGAPQGSPFIIDNTARSKFGLGLSSAGGNVLAVIDTGVMSPQADVSARIISRPAVAITLSGARTIQLRFTGVLQYSTNLATWFDRTPQPVSPWTTPADQGAMFFRTR